MSDNRHREIVIPALIVLVGLLVFFNPNTRRATEVITIQSDRIDSINHNIALLNEKITIAKHEANTIQTEKIIIKNETKALQSKIIEFESRIPDTIDLRAADSIVSRFFKR